MAMMVAVAICCVVQATGRGGGVSFVPTAPGGRTSATEVVFGPRTSLAEGDGGEEVGVVMGHMIITGGHDVMQCG